MYRVWERLPRGVKWPLGRDAHPWWWWLASAFLHQERNLRFGLRLNQEIFSWILITSSRMPSHLSTGTWPRHGKLPSAWDLRPGARDFQGCCMKLTRPGLVAVFKVPGHLARPELFAFCSMLHGVSEDHLPSWHCCCPRRPPPWVRNLSQWELFGHTIHVDAWCPSCGWK